MSRIYTKYGFEKLDLDKPTFIRGVSQNIRQAADNYRHKHGMVFKVKSCPSGVIITLLSGEQPLVKESRIVENLKDTFFTKSDIVVPLDRGQIETLKKYRNDLDHRMINNVDTYYHKHAMFDESRNITKFINSNNNVK